MSSTQGEPPEPAPVETTPRRERRRRLPLEGLLIRLVLTAGVIGIGVAIAAIMRSQHSQGWLIGLVVSIVSVVLTAIQWRL